MLEPTTTHLTTSELLSHARSVEEMLQPYLTSVEACHELDVTPQTLRSWGDRAYITYVKLPTKRQRVRGDTDAGHDRLYHRDEVARLKRERNGDREE